MVHQKERYCSVRNFAFTSLKVIMGLLGVLNTNNDHDSKVNDSYRFRK